MTRVKSQEKLSEQKYTFPSVLEKKSPV